MENTNIKIEDLELSIRAHHVLKEHNIDTIDDLCNLTESQLVSFKKCGRKTVDEILSKLYYLGRELKSEPSEIPEYDKQMLSRKWNKYWYDSFENYSLIKMCSDGFDIHFNTYIDNYRIIPKYLYKLIPKRNFEIFMIRALEEISYSNFSYIFNCSVNRIQQIYNKTIREIKCKYFTRFLFLKDNMEYNHVFNDTDKIILNLFEKSYKYNTSKVWDISKIHSNRVFDGMLSYLNFYFKNLEIIYTFDKDFYNMRISTIKNDYPKYFDEYYDDLLDEDDLLDDGGDLV